MGPLISLFGTSGDVSSRFQSQVGSLICGGGVRDCVAYSAQFRARLPSFKIQPVAKSEPGKTLPNTLFKRPVSISRLLRLN